MLIISGCLFAIIGTWQLSFLTSEFGFEELFLPQVLRGIGSQLLWIGNQYLAMQFVLQAGIQNAASVFNLVLRGGGAVSIAIANIFLEKLSFISYGDISSIVSDGPQIISGIKQKMEGLFSSLPMISNLDPNYKTIIAAEMLGQREGFIIAVNNIMFTIVWIALIPIILIPLCKIEVKNN